MQKHRYSMIEILVVIAIMVILAGMTMAAVGHMQRKAAESKARAQIVALETAFIQYQTDYGYFPQQPTVGILTVSLLNSLIKPTGQRYLDWSGKGWAVIGVNCLDEFGQPFYLQSPGTRNPETFDIWSSGQDRKFGDSKTTTPAHAQTHSEKNDDITNWKRGY